MRCGSRANRKLSNPIARKSVPLTLRDRTALPICRKAERDAIIGKRFVKSMAFNILITLLAGTKVENSPQWAQHAKGKTHKRNTTVVCPFFEFCTACLKRKNGNYPSFNCYSQWAAHKATKEHKFNHSGPN